jgi:hypothetical protein
MTLRRWLRRTFRPDSFPKCATCGHFDYEHFDFMDPALRERLFGCAHWTQGIYMYCLCEHYVPPVVLPVAVLRKGS